MRASTIIFLVFFISCNRNESSDIPNEDVVTLSKRNLKGKVKKITEYPHVFSPLLNKYTFVSEVYKYDEKGYETEFCIYHETGKRFSSTVYEYDDKHRLIKSNFVMEDDVPRYARYIYKDNLIEKIMEDSGNVFVSRDLFKYNSESKMLEKTSVYIRAGDTIRSADQFIYGSDGRLLEERNSDSGKVVRKVTYKYDGRGNPVEQSWYKPADSLADRVVRKYDDMGNMIEFKSFESRGKLKNHLIDKYGNFDKMNNYLVDSTYENGKLTGFAIREIEYY